MGEPRTIPFAVQPMTLAPGAARLLRPRHRRSRLLPALPVVAEVAEVEGLSRALRAAVEQGTGNGVLDIRDGAALTAVASEFMAIMLDNQRTSG